jgi:hypothetical protein
MCQSNTMSDGALASSRRPSKSQVVPENLQKQLRDVSQGAPHEVDVKKVVVMAGSDSCPDLEEEADLSSGSSNSNEGDQRCEYEKSLSSAVERRMPPSPMQQPRKPILKRVPSLNVRMASTSDSAFARQSAAKPRRLKSRSSSLPDCSLRYEEPPLRQISAPASNGDVRRRSSAVTFDKVEFRQHALTVGDHPDCMYGPPLSLDWDIVGAQALDLEQYEGAREKRRNMRQMQMNAFHRKNLLTFKFGLTDEELDAATKEKEKVRRRRSLTRTMLPAMKIEDGLRSAGRKFRRAVDADARKGEKEAKDYVRRHSSSTLSTGLDSQMLEELRALDSDDES